MDILSRTITIIVITVLYTAVTDSADCNATFKSSSEDGDNVFAFQAGTNATITITYQCFYSNHKIDIYWTKFGQNATEGSKLGEFYLDKYDIYSFQTLTLTLTNIDETIDRHIIYIINNKTANITASPLVTVIYRCLAADLPSKLNYFPIKQVYSYNDTVRAKCLLENLFLYGSTYNYAHMDVMCGQYGKWNIPTYECSPGCPSPYGVDQYDQYKVGTELDLYCETGRLFSAESPRYFMTDSKIVCRSNKLWSHINVRCWIKQSVDFTSSEQTLVSNQITAFACAYTVVTSYRVRITVGDTKFEDKVAAWLLITSSSKYNGIIATCEVIGSFGIIVRKTSTMLNVLYAPELLNDVNNLQFKLQQERSGQAVIKFNANPLLSLDDIKIEKNGEKIEHYYLKFDGFTHNVVVDFVKVNASNFGDYVITMTSRAPVKRILAAQFTISKSEESAKQLTMGETAAITSALVILVSVIAVAVYMTRRMCVKSKPKMATERREDAVTYQPNVSEYNIYDGIGTNQENGIAQNQRECDGHPAQCNSTNTGHKMPMKPLSG